MKPYHLSQIGDVRSYDSDHHYVCDSKHPTTGNWVWKIFDSREEAESYASKLLSQSNERTIRNA